MANVTTMSNAAAIASCNAIVDLTGIRLNTTVGSDLIDGGAGAGLLRIYDGSQPTNPDVAVGAQVLLAELTCSDPAFGNAADNTGKATATASAITSDTSANATGTASWFRVVDSNGLAIIDGSVGTSGADLNLSTVSIVATGTVAITSWTYSVSET